MIQLNLLPDVKIAYIKARAQKRLVITISTFVAAGALLLFVLLFSYVNGVQGKNLNDLTKDIKKSSSELQATKDLDKILTVQNQLVSLGALHDVKPSTERLAGYLAKTTPSVVNLSSLELDFTLKTVTVTGTGGSLKDVNTYTDTLKFTKYSTATDSKKLLPAFSNVVLSSFGVDEETGRATFTITFAFDEVIFDSKQEVTLSVKDRDGNESGLNDDIFKSGATVTTEGQE